MSKHESSNSGHWKLLEELEQLDTPHIRRREIGQQLSQSGDPRQGVGLNENSLPDIAWCPVDVPLNSTTTIKKISYPIQPFEIAKYPVTYIQFQAFIDHPHGFNDSRWWVGFPEHYQQQAIKSPRQPFSNYPHDYVSWYQAIAFCRWLSYEWMATGIIPQYSDFDLMNPLTWPVTLPTEAQWQWVAQNGMEGRKYPWGAWDERLCNTAESGLGSSTAVGMYPNGKAASGALDMAGNLREWCLNHFDNPDDITINHAHRTLRGGDWLNKKQYARNTFRNSIDPSNRVINRGFRLCRFLAVER